MIEIKEKKDFFAWCASKGITRPEEIAEYFRLSAQTIRNWERDVKSGNPSKQKLATWATLAIIYYEKTAGENGKIVLSDLEPMTFSALNKWQNEHGMKTLESTGSAFSIKRQAVHLWQKRQSIPEWVALACAGYSYLQEQNKK